MLSYRKLRSLDPHQVQRYYRPNHVLNNPINDNIPCPKQATFKFARKVRIFPNTQQKEFFNKMLGANRHFFNKTNQYIKDNPQDARRFNHYYMRQKMFYENPEHWYDEIPYDSRSYAVKQCTSAYKTAFKNLQNGNIDRFDIGYLSKKQTDQVFFVDTRAFDFKTHAIFPAKLLQHSILKIKEQIIETTASKLIIQKTKPGVWFLCIPYKGFKSVYKPSKFRNVFMDPGSRTFLTCYNHENRGFGKLGDGMVERMMPLGIRVDKLVSLASKARGRKKRNLKKRAAKIRYHMKNKIRDMHWKCCSILTNNFQNIFLPYFDTQRICDSITRNISSKAVRNIMSLSHGAFRTRIEHAAITKQRSLFYVPEAYTTKTCPSCGTENNLGASKWHSCGCGYEGDRDETAAMNICVSTVLLAGV